MLAVAPRRIRGYNSHHMSHRTHRRFHIITLGCPKNQVDSEAISERLVDAGSRPTGRLERADVIIVNTCGFLEAARQEAIDTLRELTAIRRPGQQIIAAGCLAQRQGAGLAREVPGLDGIMGVRSWPDLPALLDQISARATRRREPLLCLPETGAVSAEMVPLRRDGLGNRASAYLKIADGCSATCAFCAIPAIKGPALSRPREVILHEACALADRGVGEIILIAQDTTAYGRDRGERDGLPALIEAVLSAAPELRWLRLMYTYPGQATERLIEVMAARPQVCHYLDMPVQHGHPDTLRRMRRPSDVAALLRWIEALRAAMPDIALRTSLIVGYPGETEAEFQGLLDFMQAAQFDRAGVFHYSREPDTPAYDLPDQVPNEIKQARYERAMQHQQTISLTRNQTQLGRRLEVLVEGSGDGISVARSYRDAPEVDGFVLVQSEHPTDDWLAVRVTGATTYDLVAVSDQPTTATNALTADCGPLKAGRL
jgi:ribosomal protein S12 methylthiotransferase